MPLPDKSWEGMPWQAAIAKLTNEGVMQCLQDLLSAVLPEPLGGSQIAGMRKGAFTRPHSDCCDHLVYATPVGKHTPPGFH